MTMTFGGESGRGRARIAAWVALAVAIVLVPALVVALSHRRAAPRLPMLGEVPTFSLVDQGGKTLTRDDLLGRVWITDFFFTRCTSRCPMLTHHLHQLQERLAKVDPAGRVGLLSFSVDPKDDTPKVLAAYASHWQADTRRWTFLTGDPKTVEDAVTHGFRVTMSLPTEKKGGPSDFQILHSQRLVLVDAEGHIRGYYGSDKPGLAKVLHDALGLADEAKAGS